MSVFAEKYPGPARYKLTLKIVQDDLNKIKKCYSHCMNYFDKGIKVLRNNFTYYDGVNVSEEPDNITTNQLHEIIDTTSTKMSEFIKNYSKRMDQLHVALENIYNNRAKLVTENT